MGLIRKTLSVSTFGGVKYTSRREAQTKLALEQTKALRAERKADQPPKVTLGSLIRDMAERKAAQKAEQEKRDT